MLYCSSRQREVRVCELRNVGYGIDAVDVGKYAIEREV
jgi:hypothetical protein